MCASKKTGVCPICGKEHKSTVKEVVSGKGAIKKLIDFVKDYKKVFVLADKNTFNVAGEKVINILNENNIAYSKYIFQDGALEPDERAVGSAVMHFDTTCDIIVAIGSGVVNDIGKIVSNVSKRPYIIVATAPSMDGYASATSSTIIDGFKISVNSKAPDFIIGDTDILKTAPDQMLKSGLGDMIAKYVSICEWRIAKLLLGEYYCEAVAKLVRSALKKCVDNADGLLKRDDDAIEAVFSGLVKSGVAMNYAGLSRPASGMEHYISHVWDMRALSKGTPADMHGIQCGIGTFTAAKLYDKLKKVTPDKDKALAYVKSFDNEKWNKELRDFVGVGAESMILQEKTEQKYNLESHKKRLDKIIENWDEILKIVSEELPTANEIEKILDTIKAPKLCSDIGLKKSIMPMTFKTTKDVRDKYILSRLLWDLGLLDEFADTLSE